MAAAVLFNSLKKTQAQLRSETIVVSFRAGSTGIDDREDVRNCDDLHYRLITFFC